MDKLKSWVSNYAFDTSSKKRVGLIMAGNLPLVGFHDWLSIFVSGHLAIVKLSSKDQYLFPAIMNFLNGLRLKGENHTIISEKLPEIDAIIATGSNNSNRYFSYYFGHLPHLFRGHRNSIAVVPPDVSDEELNELGDDVFSYFGLGCRSVSLCLIPEEFDVQRLLKVWSKFSHYRDHSKWDNNFRYNYAMMLMNQEEFLTNDVIILKEASSLSSRIATIHLHIYKSDKEVDEFIQQHQKDIQVVVGRPRIDERTDVGFGESQRPGLSDYADHIDTLKFLTNL